jgi:predicted TIM-barrel fold metal-dependent hydrolase
MVGPIADAHPELLLTIDHLGMTGSVREVDVDPTIDELVKLASRPNVAVKASSLPSIARDAYPYRSMHDRIHRVLDAFGPRRMFWGSDLTRLPGSYREGVTMFTEELGFLAGADLEWVMGQGVCTWLGWK